MAPGPVAAKAVPARLGMRAQSGIPAGVLRHRGVVEGPEGDAGAFVPDAGLPVVVHAVHIPGTLLAVLNQVPADIAQLEKAQRDSVWEMAEPLLEESPVTVKRVDLNGYPADALVEYAEQVGAGLIVIGSRGRGELAALFLGSTSHRVLHLAHCDVLVIKGG